jgi:glyoxylase-like metal-dependent hydrolase (beta-lactamase superfamily II)
MSSVRVHHLNATSLCVPGGRLVYGSSPAHHLVCHVLLLELPETLMLVDTGFGLNDVAAPTPRNHPMFLAELQPDLKEERTAVRQIEALGFRAEDVGHIVLTHLDFDHAGGLDDFPRADVHLMGSEYAAAKAQATWHDRARYRPQQWSTMPRWHAYSVEPGSDRWFGFEAVRGLDGIGPDVLLVPLIGHTLGHAGIAIDTDHGWLLHCGDAYFFHGEMDPDRPWCPPGLRLYQRFMEKRRAMRLWNQERLRELRRDHGHEVKLFCAHDALELRQVRHEERRVEVEADREVWYP